MVDGDAARAIVTASNSRIGRLGRIWVCPILEVCRAASPGKDDRETRLRRAYYSFETGLRVRSAKSSEIRRMSAEQPGSRVPVGRRRHARPARGVSVPNGVAALLPGTVPASPPVGDRLAPLALGAAAARAPWPSGGRRTPGGAPPWGRRRASAPRARAGIGTSPVSPRGDPGRAPCSVTRRARLWSAVLRAGRARRRGCGAASRRVRPEAAPGRGARRPCRARRPAVGRRR